MRAGIACALAVLIRPNLAPLAIVPLFLAERTNRIRGAGGDCRRLPRLHAMVWYGSPLQSGYGSADELFSFANIAPNASRYFNWLMATAPVLFLAPFGFAARQGDSTARARWRLRAAGDRGLSDLRRVRSLVVPAIPVARTGGLRDLRRHRTHGVDRAVAGVMAGADLSRARCSA